MKTLHTLRNLSKLGGTLSRIVFIFCCIIGFCGCLAGVLSLALGAEMLKFNGETLEHLLLTEADVTVGTLYAAMAVGAILCAGEAVLSRFAMHYFKRMLAGGTPFSPDGAKELMRLGVLTLCIPLGAQLAAGIVQAAIVRALPQAAPLHLDASGSVTLGVMMIVLSLVCRYGAELHEKNDRPAV